MPPLKKADQQAKLSGRQPKAFGQKTRRVALMLQATSTNYHALLVRFCVVNDTSIAVFD